MRSDIYQAESDGIEATMVVHGEVDEAVIAAIRYASVDELRCKRAMASGAWNVIYALLGDEQLTSKQAALVPVRHEPRGDYCTVFLVVTREQMGHKSLKQRSGDDQRALSFHASYLSQ